MHELPTEWTALCALVFLLGLKHGFDADHLATIDGLTRYNARQHRWFGRYCGALFSLGHGVVVLVIALAVGVASERWDAPAWLEVFGAWTSILFLTLIGIVNLHAEGAVLALHCFKRLATVSVGVAPRLSHWERASSLIVIAAGFWFGS